MFFNKSKQSFGLDISEKSLRVVQLKKQGNKIKLVSFNEVKVPPGLFKNSLIVKEAQLLGLLKKLIKTVHGHRLNGSYATVCLPEPKTFIKVIDVPRQSGPKLLANIVEETKKHIPFPLEKTYFDWQYVDKKDSGRVIIGVCPKNVVDNYQLFLNQAGLLPVALEIEDVAIARALFPLNRPTAEPVMVLDFGASRTGLLVYEKDYIPFSLSLDFSSDKLTESIKNNLKMTWEKADEAKRLLGLSSNNDYRDLFKLLQIEINSLVKEIREAKYFYNSHFSGHQELKVLYLTGGGANMPDLAPYLSQQVNMEVRIANPLTNITGGGMALPDDKIQSFTTTIGLALRQFE